ncbi:MAG: hypothetical protein V1848_03055 [Candidatus Magasanikbacteria bacterium]
MTKKIFLGMAAALVMGASFVPSFAFAADGDEEAGVNEAFGLTQVGTTGLGNEDIRATIGSIINVALGLLGVVALVIILFAGFEWMTAGGAEDKVASARKRMVAGVIGLAIILSSYALSTFVLKELAGATNFDTEVANDF